jgi:hypothetical protein
MLLRFAGGLFAGGSGVGLDIVASFWYSIVPSLGLQAPQKIFG